MSNVSHANHPQPFTISEIFKVPELNVYEQMVCIVLSSMLQSGASHPTVADIAGIGRMSSKQTSEALQSLVEKRVIPLRVFRDILGDYGDSRLSWAAKGMLVYLKQHEGNTLSDLYEVSNDDADHIMMELKELQRFGYLDEHPIMQELD
ncbi:hypothetical protein ACFQ88_05060 [Paenibacillus sp. NPDC056579]|uniref:hypothetical protein n=1 Tax=Paenibacillus sp. NPDC056579 TaxID=3345871 RepID=UPI0036969B9A